MEEKELAILIQKYLQGVATPHEESMLLKWYHHQNLSELELPYSDREEAQFAQQQMLDRLQQQTGAAKRKIYKMQAIYYEAAAIIVVALGLVLLFFLRKADTVETKFAHTHPGEHCTLKLPDGSTVWLGAQSNLRYPASFNKSKREVYLEGEGFFAVVKDARHPFLVHADKTTTRVLGTSFQVKAYPQQRDVVVALITGKVFFQARSGGKRLHPGQQVIYNKIKGISAVQTIAAPDAITQRRFGYYEYRNQPVNEVLEDINRNFALHVTAEESVRHCTFYGQISPHETPEKFLKKLALVLNAQLIKTSKGYLLKGGCE